MFRRLGGDPGNLPHLRRVEALMRVHFGLAGRDLVLVAEDAPRQPGFPPEETVVRFWVGETRHRLRVFKPASEVGEGDLPPAWLLPSLVDDGEPDCC